MPTPELPHFVLSEQSTGPRAPDPRHSTRSRDEKKHINQDTGLTLRHRNSVTEVLSRLACAFITLRITYHQGNWV
jgi:hypothetical protein